MQVEPTEFAFESVSSHTLGFVWLTYQWVASQTSKVVSWSAHFVSRIRNARLVYNLQVNNLEQLELRHQRPHDVAQRHVFKSYGLGRNMFKSLLAGSAHFDNESVVVRYPFQPRIHTLSEPWVTHLRRFRGSTLDTFGHALTFLDVACNRTKSRPLR